jgi:replicative DNA helicase
MKSLNNMVNDWKDIVSDPIKEKEAIPTNFSDFDQYFEGIREGELILLGARPGMGVTQFLINLTLSLKDRPTLYFTYENDLATISKRINHLLTNTPLKDVIAVQSELVHPVIKERIYFDDLVKISLPKLISRLKIQIEDLGLKVIIIDSIHLLKARNRSNKIANYTKITAELKKLAIETNTTIITSITLNSQLEKKVNLKPQLIDLRKSAQISDNVDKVILLYRANYYGKTHLDFPLENRMEVFVEKNSIGNTGNIDLLIHPSGALIKANQGFQE